MRYFFICCLFVTPVLAQQQPDTKSMVLTGEDQKNFREVCRVAMQNPSQTTDNVFSLSTWCIIKLQQLAVPQQKDETK